MPEKARVFVAEDDPSVQQGIKRLLSRDGHEVILQAQTLVEALRDIERFEELGIQVAVIDGNLSPDDDSGSDGYQLAMAIRQRTPRVKTVGMSSSIVDGVDINVGKRRIFELSTIITDL